MSFTLRLTVAAADATELLQNVTQENYGVQAGTKNAMDWFVAQKKTVDTKIAISSFWYQALLLFFSVSGRRTLVIGNSAVDHMVRY